VAATRIISIIGRKNAGKTTLAVALADEFARKGRRVMMMKHAANTVDADRSGTDSYRHLTEGKAERVLVESPGMRTIIERRAVESGPEELARRYFDGADIVLAEGFSSAPIPKIEVFRRTASDSPLYQPSLPGAALWLAIVTDDDRFEAECPVLRFRDTMWLQLLANMAWERAKVLE
jgi:molybdopterin-guanine dinucleotide biosynthesis protein MobB